MLNLISLGFSGLAAIFLLTVTIKPHYRAHEDGAFTGPWGAFRDGDGERNSWVLSKLSQSFNYHQHQIGMADLLSLFSTPPF